MSWADIYLVCFVVGVGMSVVSLLLGSVHLHIPHLHFHHGIHLSQGPAHGGTSTKAPWFNFGSMSAFLAWFGGTGYLLRQHYNVWFGLALVIATLSGIGAAVVVTLFLARVLLRHEAPLNPADYDMTGVLGHISVPIRPGGTGEIVYSQEGIRRCAGARSENGVSIPKGAEVMVMRYDKGIAYVTPWEDPTDQLELRNKGEK